MSITWASGAFLLVPIPVQPSFVRASAVGAWVAWGKWGAGLGPVFGHDAAGPWVPFLSAAAAESCGWIQGASPATPQSASSRIGGAGEDPLRSGWRRSKPGRHDTAIPGCEPVESGRNVCPETRFEASSSRCSQCIRIFSAKADCPAAVREAVSASVAPAR